MENRSAPHTSAASASHVIADLALVLNQGLDVREVQALVVEKAVAALSGSAGSVIMAGDGPDGLQVLAAIGLKDPDAPCPPESRVAEWVMNHDEPLLLIGRTGPLAHLLHREDIRDAVCVPLRYAGTPIGALSVSNSVRRGRFDEGDVELLTTIASLAAVAVRNTILYNEAREHRERLRAVLNRLWAAEEDERRVLASDLHDGAAQALYNTVFRLQTARHRAQRDPASAVEGFQQAEDAARDALAQLRAVMAGLRPMSLDDLGLVPALRSEAAAVTARGFVRVDVSVAGEPRRLGGAAEIGLFRMAREALSNAERHSGSDRASLELRFDAEGIAICVEDWGRGFDESAARSARHSGRLGLAALHERADSLGLALSVRSRIGEGTRITMRLPWAASHQEDSGAIWSNEL